uniref:Uncharacterized protein n=1 Tax=viral metagenome TaxID=1070528 RepID=A0A6H1ZAP2_9ZZZZ
MTQAYSDPTREDDLYSLPDVEVFYLSSDNQVNLLSGWYWWTCFPGCLPDGDPDGPYDTEEEALDAAQDI